MRSCPTCHKPLIKKGYEREKHFLKRKFCNSQCMGIFFRAQNSPTWTGGKKKRVCSYCNKNFQTYISPSSKNGGKCCSKKCADLNRQKKILKKCPICQIEIHCYPYQICCSRRCANKHRVKYDGLSPKERNEDRRLKKYYNIGLSHKKSIFEKQLGQCAICQKEIKFFDLNTHIDHNHENGKVRGILCSFCNNGLGCFKDNKQFLQAAINYLQAHSNTPTTSPNAPTRIFLSQVQ